MEVLAGDYLIEKGYHIIQSGAVNIWNSRLREQFTGSRWGRWTEEEHKQFELLQAILRKLSLHTYGYDYLCKKGKSGGSAPKRACPSQKLNLGAVRSGWWLEASPHGTRPSAKCKYGMEFSRDVVVDSAA